MKEFKKSDLETGMLIMHANGNIGLLVNTTIIHVGNHWTAINHFNPDLTAMCNITTNAFDITAVSQVLEGYLLCPKHWNEEVLRKYLLWERKKEISEYTMPEAIEKMGHKFKIKK